MYIQPSREEREELTLPQGYSGSAFRQAAPPPPTVSPDTVEPPEAAPPPDPEPAPQAEVPRTEDENEPKTTPVGRFSEEKPNEGGLLGRFPFLSALLPPRRRKKEGLLPEWVLIAAVFFLFFTEEEETDILPFLLLLLLWD